MSSYLSHRSTRFSPHEGAAGFFVLLTVLIVGELVYVSVSPGTFPVDVLEVILPVGITGGLLVAAYLLWVHGDRSIVDPLVSLYGWFGALVGGTVAVWLAVFESPVGLPFDHVYGEALTALSLGIAVGTLIGITVTHANRSVPRREPGRGSVLAEAKWTDRSGADPIVMEIVEQISNLQEADPLEIPPLETVIDTEVFERLRTGGKSPWQLRFVISEYELCVSSHGTITVSNIQLPEKESGAALIRSSLYRDGIPPIWNGSQASSTPAGTSRANPAQKVRESVAEYEGVDAADLPPLDEWIRPMTSEALTGSWKQLDSSIEFTYLWYHVTVQPNGDVHVRTG